MHSVDMLSGKSPAMDFFLEAALRDACGEPPSLAYCMNGGVAESFGRETPGSLMQRRGGRNFAIDPFLKHVNSL